MTSKTSILACLAAAALAASLPSAAGAGEPAAAVDARGDVHLASPSAAGATYGFCAAGCARAGERTVTFALETPATAVAVAVGPDGKPRLALQTVNRVHHAVCEGDCTRREGWTTTVAIEHAGRFALEAGSLAVSADGATSFRLVPVSGGPAFLAACAGACADPARWAAHLDVRRTATEVVAAGR